MRQVARHSTMEVWGGLVCGAISPAWPGGAIRPRLATAHRRRRGDAWDTAAVAASQRLCGTLGMVGHRGMSRAVDPLWGNVAPPCAGAGGGAWSPREASSGQAPCPALACGQPRDRAPRPDGVSRTAWGTPARRHARSRLRFL